MNESGSWYGVTDGDQPISSYFRITGASDDRATSDGWPSESFVEMQYAKRVLAGFGHIDAQMLGYVTGTERIVSSVTIEMQQQQS